MKTKAITSIMMLLFLANILVVAIPIETTYACYPRIRYRKTFVVNPSGGDDTTNIQAAFDEAVLAGPGSTVKLTAGTFHLSSPIVVVNFDGHFKGAGKHVTIVQDLGEEPFPLMPPPLEPVPALFAFYQNSDGAPSHIKFSDMTIRATNEAVPWWVHNMTDDSGEPVYFHSMDLIRVYGKITKVRDFEVSYVSTSTERMGFEGKEGDFPVFGFNVLNGLVITGENIWDNSMGSLLFNYTKPITGTHTITRSSFRNLGSSCPSYGLEDSTLKVKGNKIDNVLVGVEIVDFSNTVVKISRNKFKNVHWAGVYVAQAEQSGLGLDFGPQGPLPELSTLLVSYNTIHCIEFADGVAIRDYAPMVGAEKRLNTVILRNKIILDNTWYGGIVGIWAQDVWVLFNHITGTGWAGIYMGVYEDQCSGWKIIGNNVKKVDADAAPIWLGPGTSDCLVVGRKSTLVLDEGEDNILVGVTEM